MKNFVFDSHKGYLRGPVDDEKKECILDMIENDADEFFGHTGDIVIYAFEKIKGMDIKTECSLRIAYHPDHGICFKHEFEYKPRKSGQKTFMRYSVTHLAVWDITKLDIAADLDEISYASEGLFLPIEPAVGIIEEYLYTGKMCTDVDWIMIEAMPEEGDLSKSKNTSGIFKKEIIFDCYIGYLRGSVDDEKKEYILDMIENDTDEFFEETGGNDVIYISEEEEGKGYKTKRSLRFDYHPDHGICITHEIEYKPCENDPKMFISDYSVTHLAVWDITKLDTVVDLDDESYSSTGLFLPIEQAVDVIKEYLETGKMSTNVKWVMSESMPEGVSYI